METKKFVVELDIPEQMEKIITLGRLRLSEILTPRIESALNVLGKGKIVVRVYDFGGEPELTELFRVCPSCGHGWGKHLLYVNQEGQKLEKPVPDFCEECGEVREADPPKTRCHALTVIAKQNKEPPPPTRFLSRSEESPK